MRLYKLLIKTGGILLIGNLAWGQQSYFYCNNAYIYPGDSLDKVLQTCGNPAKKETKTASSVKLIKAEQWIYNFQPNSGLNFSSMATKQNALIINFVAGKAYQIFVENQPVVKTNYCRPDVSFQIGDSTTYVYQLCMWPNIRQEILLKKPGPPTPQTIFTYQTDPNAAPTKLYFENGTLKEIE